MTRGDKRGEWARAWRKNWAEKSPRNDEGGEEEEEEEVGGVLSSQGEMRSREKG